MALMMWVSQDNLGLAESPKYWLTITLPPSSKSEDC